MNIAKVIREYRKKAGMTQEEMAKRLGVTTPAVNKWENGNSKPDIELLAPIARLLHISLDTLLSFHEELQPSEINEIIREMDNILSTEGFEKAYGWAAEKINEYPNCNGLIWQVAVMLDAKRIMDDCPDSEKYDEQINAWYERALNDENEEIRHHAADALFGFYMRKKEYEKAGEYLQFFANDNPVKKIYQGRLYREQREKEKAYKTFESILFSEYQTINSTFSLMMTMALEEGDIKRTRYLAEKMGALAGIFEMGRYRECSSMLDVVCAEKNSAETNYIARQLLESADSLFDFEKSELYMHMEFRQPDSSFAEGLKENLLELFRDEESFGYMRGNKDWENIIEK